MSRRPIPCYKRRTREADQAHTEFLSNFLTVIANEATKTLRSKYGEMYGFDEATPRNAEMVAWAMFEYR